MLMGKISAFTENNLSEETMRNFSDLVIHRLSLTGSPRLTMKIETGQKAGVNGQNSGSISRLTPNLQFDLHFAHGFCRVPSHSTSKK